MRKIQVFNNVSLDGFFVDSHGQMSWAHQADPEWAAFSADNARDGGGVLVFGRKTFEMMEAFWPSAAAQQQAPEVAAGMTGAEKIVFSRTRNETTWANTTFLGGDPATEMARLKAEPGNDFVIMGSGTIISQLAAARLIDSYQLVVCPLVLGGGRTLFESVDERFGLKLVKTRAFGNGNVVLWYELA